MSKFEKTLKAWAEAQRLAVETRVLYERTFARAVINANGKAADVRKAQADLEALDESRQHRLAEVEAQRLHSLMTYLQTHPDP
jgi:hypothetical protein